VEEILGMTADGRHRHTINVRLTGFFNGGYDPSLPVRFRPLAKLGGQDRIAKSHGLCLAGWIYPCIRMSSSRRPIPVEGYNINRQASKTMDGRNARIYAYYNNVTQKGERPRYILSPVEAAEGWSMRGSSKGQLAGSANRRAAGPG
jgi:hypothetical protein